MLPAQHEEEDQLACSSIQEESPLLDKVALLVRFLLTTNMLQHPQLLTTSEQAHPLNL
jgi:hypothetical protein